MNKICRIILTLFLMTLLVSCNLVTKETTSTDTISGEILVWHTWKGEERESLKELFNNFKSTYPDVSIVEESYSQSQINKLFQYQVDAGLGPDILIAPADWAESLAKKQFIRDISGSEVKTEDYLPSTMTMLQDGEKLYGLPLSLNTMILYYNKTLLSRPNPTTTVAIPVQKSTVVTATPKVTTTTITTASQTIPLPSPEPEPAPTEEVIPATDLDMLLEQLNKGHKIAMQSDFYGAFWGVQAFGGELFDKEGRVILNQGGFANWLSWLKQAQSNPTVILNRNRDDLLALFKSGRATYYIGSTLELPALRAALGEEVVGAIRLPGRQKKSAGPFLQTEALMFNQVSSNKSFNLALRLAQYLGNNEQQRKLALNVGKLPANKQVSIDPRISPIVAEFIAQSKTSVSVNLNEASKVKDIIDEGNDIYAQVLDGQMNVGQAATQLTRNVNKKYELETIIATAADNCKLKGNLTVWNTWTENRSKVLGKIKENFLKKCPDVTITMVEVNPIEFASQYAKAIEEGNPPDIFTGNSNQIRDLAPTGTILELSELVESDFFQRFIPIVEKAIRYESKPYLIPVNMNLMALYYNKTLVESPPIVLDDLLTMATPETPIAIPMGFQEGFWGLGAFGESMTSVLLNDEKRLVIGQYGLVDWLAWLKEAQTQPGFIFDQNIAKLQAMFVEGKATILVGYSNQFEGLQQALGDDKLGVAKLPSGSPLLDVDGFFISPYTAPKKQQIAATFAKFVTDVNNQELLMTEANQIPININVGVADYPAMQTFFDQTNTAIVIPNDPKIHAVYEWGHLVYEQVLQNNIEPARAVADFTDLVDVTNGFEVADKVVENIAQDCTDEGTVTLWEGWSEVEQLAWQQVISDFAKICPTIQIKTTTIPRVELTSRLTTTLQAVTATTSITGAEIAPPERPDFFIAGHENLEMYQKMGLVRDITAFLPQEKLIDYLPKAVAAMSLKDTIYGIPQTLHLPALYYHADTVSEPATNFEDLLSQVKQGQKIGLNPNFYQIIWGGAAFGCEPCEGQFFNEQGDLQLKSSQVVSWFTWLKTISNTNQAVFNSDQQALQQLFLTRTITYMVAGPEFLNEAKTKLGVANVGVMPLPMGAAEKAARPFVSVDGFFFYQQATDEQIKLALKFAEFAVSRKNQTQLMKTANFVPVNNFTLITVDDAIMKTFVTGINNTLLWPEESERLLLEENSVFNTFDPLYK